MSKIIKAMEKARRGGASESVEPEDLERDASASEPSASTARTQHIHAPDHVLEANRILTHIHDPKVADYYSLLRTQILQATRERGWNTIMVTSVGPGEGKTLTAINLAVSIAREVQQTALLVDAVLRGPRIHEYLGLEVDKGLSDYLIHDTPISELLVNPGLDKLVVLPGGRPLAGSSEVLGSPKMRRLVQELKGRYPDRYVIFDCPHVLNMSDALVFSSYVEGIVMVVEAGGASRKSIEETIDLLGRDNIIGLALNKAEF